MGIHGLTKLISDNAPGAIKEGNIDNYFGRKIAIDASMSIYQFLIAVRSAGDGHANGQLTNDAGEVTSHITGMLYRTIRMMEAGIKPVFVFDGKAPTMKSGELAKRKERQKAAEEELAKLQQEGGSAEDIERQQKRTVRASREQSEEVKTLLKLMGLPVLDAPCEAEATCAVLAKAGKVYGTGTEDADALTFGTPFLIRHLNVAESRKLPIVEVNLERALEGLQLSQEQFIDLCILCGCDYTDSIKGIGPIKALGLIRQHGSIEAIIKVLDTKKYPLPEPFPFEEARALFVKPDVADAAGAECDFKWTDCDADGLRKYLIEDKQFAAERVNKAIERMQKCKGKNSQGRLESFFGPTTIKPSEKKLAPKTLGKGKGKQTGGPASKKQKK
jgi:flap endonuclease-1